MIGGRRREELPVVLAIHRREITQRIMYEFESALPTAYDPDRDRYDSKALRDWLAMIDRIIQGAERG